MWDNTPHQFAIAKRIGNSGIGFMHNHIWASVWGPIMRHVDESVRHGLKHSAKDHFDKRVMRSISTEIKWRVKAHAR